MTCKTINKFLSEIWDRAVWMVLDHAGEHLSRWLATGLHHVVELLNVIGSLNVIGDIRPLGAAGPVNLSADPLGLEEREEAFHRRVIPGISRPTH